MASFLPKKKVINTFYKSYFMYNLICKKLLSTTILLILISYSSFAQIESEIFLKGQLLPALLKKKVICGLQLTDRVFIGILMKMKSGLIFQQKAATLITIFSIILLLVKTLFGQEHRKDFLSIQKNGIGGVKESLHLADSLETG